MLAALKAIIESLPEIIGLIKGFGEFIKRSKENGLWSDLEKAIDLANKAQEPKDRYEAARRLVNVMGRIGDK